MYSGYTTTTRGLDAATIERFRRIFIGETVRVRFNFTEEGEASPVTATYIIRSKATGKVLPKFSSGTLVPLTLDNDNTESNNIGTELLLAIDSNTFEVEGIYYLELLITYTADNNQIRRPRYELNVHK